MNSPRRWSRPFPDRYTVDAVQEGAQGQDLHRLSQQWPRLDHGRGLFVACQEGRDRVGARHLGDGRRRRRAVRLFDRRRGGEEAHARRRSVGRFLRQRQAARPALTVYSLPAHEQPCVPGGKLRTSPALIETVTVFSLVRGYFACSIGAQTSFECAHDPPDTASARHRRHPPRGRPASRPDRRNAADRIAGAQRALRRKDPVQAGDACSAPARSSSAAPTTRYRRCRRKSAAAASSPSRRATMRKAWPPRRRCSASTRSSPCRPTRRRSRSPMSRRPAPR